MALTAGSAFGIFVIIFLVTAIVFKVPIAFSLGLTCVGMIVFVGQTGLTLATTAFASLDSFPFLAIPFFIFAGALMQYSGISESLVNWIQSFVGRLRGSLGVIVVLTSAAFGVLTGSTMATLATVGKLLLPELKKHGYKNSYSTALVSASSFLGILIPPSVPGIFYALSAGLNISEVWLSTIGPAIILVIGYCIINYIKVGKNTEKTTEPFIATKYIKNVGKQTAFAFSALMMPIIIFGGIYGGVFTPTEAGAVSCIYGLIFYGIRKLRKKLIEKKLYDITAESAEMTAVIGLMMVFSAAAGRYLARIGVAALLTEFLTTSVTSVWIFLLICNLIFLVLGMLIDINASILITTPLLMPTVLAYGINPIHFGAIMLINLCVGYLTPPMAASTFMACQLSGESFVDVVKESWPFIIVGLFVILLTVLFPQISLFLIK